MGAEEALVVAVVGDAVGAGGVVVYEAEVEGAAGGGFGGAAEVVEAGWEGAGWDLQVVLVFLLDGCTGFGVYYLSIVIEL
jgi:hypothetical protein